MKTQQSTEGAKHFSEIVAIARELTTDIKDTEVRRSQIFRLTRELLQYQCSRPIVTVKIL